MVGRFLSSFSVILCAMVTSGTASAACGPIGIDGVWRVSGSEIFGLGIGNKIQFKQKNCDLTVMDLGLSKAVWHIDLSTQSNVQAPQKIVDHNVALAGQEAADFFSSLKTSFKLVTTQPDAGRSYADAEMTFSTGKDSLMGEANLTVGLEIEADPQGVSRPWYGPSVVARFSNVRVNSFSGTHVSPIASSTVAPVLNYAAELFVQSSASYRVPAFVLVK